MADMVVPAFVQETVSRGVSFVLGNREEKASKGHTMERLEMAHSELEFALERSGKLPITDLSLLHQRRMIKRVYEECGEVLDKHKVLVLEDEEGVTNSSSFPKRIIYAVKSSASYFFSPGKDKLCSSQVAKFELYAGAAARFVRNVEGCSLAHYRFFNPLITQLLQGIDLRYEMVQGSRTHDLWMWPLRTEEYGVVAFLQFLINDSTIPTRCFAMHLFLRLSESSDIVGIAIKCVQSLAPQFKSLVQVATGALSQLPTQDFFHCRSEVMTISGTTLLHRLVRPDPFCCRANGHKPCANNVIPSELSCRFPQEVVYVHLCGSISALEYNLQSSADEAERNVVIDWPLLKVWASFHPHSVNKSGEMHALERIGEQEEHINWTSLQQMEEMVLTNAINCFIHQPELTSYRMKWNSLHGGACFIVDKPKEKVRPKPTAGPTTRRAAKRMR